MIIKNLLPAYNNMLLSLPISSFGELCDCETRIEDAINNEQLEKEENKPPIKKTYRERATTFKAPNPVIHQKSSHKTDNCFCLKHKIQDLVDNGTLPNLNIITKHNIRKNPLPDYHRALPHIRIVCKWKRSIGIALS